MMLIVQIGFLVLARSAAGTSVEAALRKAAVSRVDPALVRQGIARDVSAVVPGAEDVVVEVVSDQENLHATVSFRWIPPGPNLVPVTVGIHRSAVQIVPP
ncbi:MAG: hypothetical protein ABFR95_03250 [Actinomycetota bacterium]